MSGSDVLLRSLSGYVFLIPGLTLYFFILFCCIRRQTAQHIAGVFLFGFYLIVLLTWTETGAVEELTPALAAVPSADLMHGQAGILYNFVLFIPLGFFIPMLYRGMNHLAEIAISGFLLSLVIELIQMFGHGTFDLLNLILHTLGSLSGFLLYRLIFQVHGREKHRAIQSAEISGPAELSFLIVYACIIMTAIQPWLIHTAWNLG